MDKRLIDIRNNTLKTENGTFDIIWGECVLTDEYRHIKILDDDDFSYYINTITGEKIAIYKEVIA